MNTTPVTDPALIPQTTEQIFTNEVAPLLSPAMFMRPDWLELSAWFEHVPFAFWLVEALQPQRFVELGTHSGTSYFSFCQAVDTVKTSTQCYAVDTWKGDEHAGFYGEECFAMVQEHNEQRYSGFSTLIRSTFDEALPYFEDGSIDLLHIDGLHTCDAVSHDFAAWLPKMSRSGIVLMHDTNVREREFGVFRCVNELRKSYPVFEFSFGHGLAVIGVGTEWPERIQRLFALTRHSKASALFHDLFARLGRACSETYQTKANPGQIGRLQQEEQRLRVERDAAQAELQQTNVTLQHTQDTLRLREAEAAERTQLRERVVLLQEMRAELKESINTQHEHFSKKMTELGEYKENCKHLQYKCNELAVQASALKSEMEAQKERMDAAIRQKEAEGCAALTAQQALHADAVRVAEERREALSHVQNDLQARFAEIAALTRRLHEVEQQVPASLSSGEMARLVVALAGEAPGSLLNRRRLKSMAKALVQQGFLDPGWYCSQYPDVAGAGHDPAVHYLLYGAQEGRSPKNGL